MPKTLYIMRHGQTLFNLRKKVQGACDSPLTEEGIRQAGLAREYFEKEGISFDAAYSSTQERAEDTLALVTDLPGTSLKGLKEWNFGLFEGESEDLNPKRREPGKTNYGSFFVDYGGEDSLEVQKRMNDTLLDIMNMEQNDTVLAVSHGGAIYMFLHEWIDFATHEPIRFSNCAIIKLTFEDNTFSFKEVINVI